jgi:methionyl-tRNA formyltransferase
MQMDAGLDTGPVLAQRAIAIDADDDAGSLHDRLAALGAELMLDTLSQLGAGRALARPQPASGTTYARKIRKEEALLDWSRPALELERAVRAFRPSPGASTSYEGEALKIWRARLCAGDGSPGTLLEVRGDGIVVACGAGALELVELQRPGGRRLQAAEFLRGRPLVRGARFG